MKIKQFFTRLSHLLWAPIGTNSVFFTWMYVLGVVCAWLTLPAGSGAKLYDNLFLELFLDLYILCILPAILPRFARPWLRAVLYVVLYATAIADVYCFTKFDSTLTPTMLLLALETDSREAGEFLGSFLSSDVLFGKVGLLLVLITLNVLSLFRRKIRAFLSRFISLGFTRSSLSFCNVKAMLSHGKSLGVATALIWGCVSSAYNKEAVYRLMSGKNIGEVEHTLTESRHAELYLPVYRLVFSVYANSLASQQLDRLMAVSRTVRVDSCTFRSPNIVLIIGESYNRHHASLYGYPMKTTPRQQKRARRGRLVPFADVVSPWNLTSFVFKHVFSTYTIGDKGEWCDYPLFPQLFRQAGYHVTFITNQFLPKASEAVYDFSGGFFLNHADLSAKMFDSRNETLHRYDEGLLDEYDNLKSKQGKHNLTIFHLIGQHVNYRQRSPDDRKRFTGEDYRELKPNLNARERRILSDYDNSLLYNDSIVDQIIRRFERQDAVIIYMPDHGEECFEGDTHFFCRMHSAKIDARLAHAEFDIPFWIWCSNQFAVKHPDVYKAIRQARHRRYMTDALPHLLLYLAGIETKAYQERHNILSPAYDEQRKRLLKATTDYDALD